MTTASEEPLEEEEAAVPEDTHLLAKQQAAQDLVERLYAGSAEGIPDSTYISLVGGWQDVFGDPTAPDYEPMEIESSDAKTRFDPQANEWVTSAEYNKRYDLG